MFWVSVRKVLALHRYSRLIRIQNLAKQSNPWLLDFYDYVYLLYLLQKVRKQRATGRTKDGATFPLSILIKPHSKKDIKKIDRDKPDKPEHDLLYKGLVWVFANISGMISFTQDGIIQTCNHNFSLMLFGYSEKDLVGQVS